MMTKKQMHDGSLWILSLWGVLITMSIAGCSHRDHPPSKTAWLSIEKNPIKVIYIDKQGVLDPVLSAKMFELVDKTKYRKTPINENTNVSVSAIASQTDIESDSDITSREIKAEVW